MIELDRGVAEFERRAEIKGNLIEQVFKALIKKPGRECLVDYSSGKRKAFKAGVIAALALAFSKIIAKQIKQKRVGIVLPPGVGGVIVNLAVSLCGKIPVNLNYSLGKRAVESCLEQAGIESMITAKAVRDKIDPKFPDFPWTENVWDVQALLPSISRKKLFGYVLMFHLLPRCIQSLFIAYPKSSGDDEAGLLFTSGSEGMPKGVELTHQNILGNIEQISACGLFPEKIKLMANLPIFHSFGYVTTIWFPLLKQIPVVYCPSPLEFRITANAMKQEQCSLFLGTPTFLRPYITHVHADELASLKAVIAGAEKTPAGFHQLWEKHFPGCRYLEGYGLTETSPVVAANVPDEFLVKNERPGTREASVGKLFKGMAARILNPDTMETQDIRKTGLLQLKGINVFKGYLNDAKRSAEVLHDGWFNTGDLAYLDDDGFLYIAGRHSRFSKLAGEMVPHMTIENEIAKAYQLSEAELPQVAVTGRLDEKKGESLVLLTVIPIERDDLLKKLSEAGLPNLWIPKEIKQVDHIPCLASGKLDLAELRALSLDH